MGKAGGAFAQHFPHGSERREQFPQQHRVADFYRQSNFLDKRQRRKARRIYALGRQRAQEKKPAYQYFAFGAGSGASESAFNGFFGCGHFVKANEFLSGFTTPIEW